MSALTEQRLYDRGWVGLTLNTVGAVYERVKFEEFFAKVPKRKIRVDWLEWPDSDPQIGGFENWQCCVWFKELETHNAFVAMLEAMEQRTESVVLGDAADMDGIEMVLHGRNYEEFIGSRGEHVLTHPKLSENDAVLLKMMVG